MGQSIYLRGLILIELLYSVNTYAESLQVNNYVVPAAFANALQQGMTVPVFIRYDGDNSLSRSRQKIADAVIVAQKGSLLVNQIELNEMPNKTELSPQIKELLGKVHSAPLSENNKIVLNENASLSLDTRSFYLELTVNKQALSAAIIPRTNTLSASTVEHLSNILNYTMGTYYNKYGNGDNTSNYFTLDNTTSIREHHFNLNGTVYGLGTVNSDSQLYRAMYERDYQGHRVAGGMVDTWNLQSIASMSALNSSRIYGASVGNKSSTQIENTSLTLVPITVFLPAAGEVHVLRNGKLLSIQNFSMGSYEIDTSTLPFGIYTVDLQIVVNGKVVNSRTAQINKTFSRKSSATGNLAWQIFSGMLEYNRMDYRNHQNIDYGKKNTWIAGVAAETSLPLLSGVTFKSTLYGFDNNGVAEVEADVVLNNNLTLNQQTLVATDRSRQSTTSLNLSIPGGFGNIWLARQASHIGDRLPMQSSHYISLGASANLSHFSPWLGNISVSRTHDKYEGNKYTNVDYSQTLFTNRWVTVALRAGVQRYYYDDRNSVNDKYINLDFSLPLSSWLSAGVSSESGNLLANATVRKSFDDSAITQVGASISKRLKSSEGGYDSYQSDDLSGNGYVSYDTKYNAGTLSVSSASGGSTNYNLSSHGSIAWTKDSFNLGKEIQSSGVVINTNFSESGKMLAQINGRNYPLTGKSNFIGLAPYAEYQVELMNDKAAEDSVDIVSGRRNKLVLYPGNVGVLNPEVKQLVTVFGRMRKPDGTAYANTDVHNHIGKTRTDKQGEFAMDVDKRYPIITLIDARGGVCEADLDLQKARGAVWVGDIQCATQALTASRTGEQDDVY